MSRRAFLICPVRGVDAAQSAQWAQGIEADGYTLHWPPRDTDQSDTVGLAICRENLKAIRRAEVVFVVWDGKSQGCLFDLGMALALRKPIRVLSMPAVEPGAKSFQAMAQAWERESPTPTA